MAVSGIARRERKSSNEVNALTGVDLSVMSNFLGEAVRRCRRKAEQCAQKAATQTDRKLKQDFLDLKESWLFLARSFAYHERPSDLSETRSTSSPLNLKPPEGFLPGSNESLGASDQRHR
jgi:hypothetical protein